MTLIEALPAATLVAVVFTAGGLVSMLRALKQTFDRHDVDDRAAFDRIEGRQAAIMERLARIEGPR